MQLLQACRDESGLAQKYFYLHRFLLLLLTVPISRDHLRAPRLSATLKKNQGFSTYLHIYIHEFSVRILEKSQVLFKYIHRLKFYSLFGFRIQNEAFLDQF